MKNGKFIASLLLVVLPFILSTVPLTVNSQWITSYSAVPPPVGSTWFEFGFATVDTGFLVVNEYWSVSTGYNYRILGTTDGGVSWSADDCQEKPAGSPNGSFVFDIAVAGADTFFYTTRSYFNFLNRWTRQGGWVGCKIPPGELPRDLSAVNGREAFVLTSGYSPEDVAVFYFNGDSLHKVFESTSYKTDAFSKIFFVSPMVGFLVLKDLSEVVVMLKSLDGGHTFTPVTLPSGMTVNSLYFVTGSNGFIAGNNGLICHTTDQGATWQQLNTGTSVTLNSINFSGPMTGMAVGNGGTVILTTDGGQTWHPEPADGNLSTGQIFSPDQAYICNTSYFPTFYKGIYPVSSPVHEYPSWSIYPNPSENEFVVGFPGQENRSPAYEITGMNGKTAIRGVLSASHTIDAGLLPAGVYCLRIFLGGTTVSRTIIKK